MVNRFQQKEPGDVFYYLKVAQKTTWSKDTEWVATRLADSQMTLQNKHHTIDWISRL